MNNTANSKKRFIVTSERFLISAGALIAEAERGYAVRDYGRIKEVGESLILTDSPAYSSIGSYFVGLGVFNNGEGPIEIARKHFLAALSFAPSHYRQRALLSLANLFYHEREYSHWRNFVESLAKLDDPFAVIEARRDLAVHESLTGNHRKALALLEDLYPLAAASPLHIRYHYWNSLAFELNESGKHEEAAKVAANLSTCPYRHRFPEWKATVQDISAKINRSKLLAFPQTPAAALREFNSLFEPNLDRLQAADFQALTATLRGRL